MLKNILYLYKKKLLFKTLIQTNNYKKWLIYNKLNKKYKYFFYISVMMYTYFISYFFKRYFFFFAYRIFLFICISLLYNKIYKFDKFISKIIIYYQFLKTGQRYTRSIKLLPQNIFRIFLRKVKEVIKYTLFIIN